MFITKVKSSPIKILIIFVNYQLSPWDCYELLSGTAAEEDDEYDDASH